MWGFGNPIIDQYDGNLVSILKLYEPKHTYTVSPLNYKTDKRSLVYGQPEMHAPGIQCETGIGFMTRDVHGLTDFCLFQRIKVVSSSEDSLPLLGFKVGGDPTFLIHNNASELAFIADSSGTDYGEFFSGITAAQIPTGDYFNVIVQRVSNSYTIIINGYTLVLYSSSGNLTADLNDVGFYVPAGETWSDAVVVLGQCFLWNIGLSQEALDFLAINGHPGEPQVPPYRHDDLRIPFSFEVEETLVRDVIQTNQRSQRSLRRKRNERQRSEYSILSDALLLCEWEEILENRLTHTMFWWTPPGQNIPKKVTCDMQEITVEYISTKVVKISLTLREV